MPPIPAATPARRAPPSRPSSSEDLSAASVAALARRDTDGFARPPHLRKSRRSGFDQSPFTRTPAAAAATQTPAPTPTTTMDPTANGMPALSATPHGAPPLLALTTPANADLHHGSGHGPAVHAATEPNRALRRQPAFPMTPAPVSRLPVPQFNSTGVISKRDKHYYPKPTPSTPSRIAPYRPSMRQDAPSPVPPRQSLFAPHARAATDPAAPSLEFPPMLSRGPLNESHGNGTVTTVPATPAAQRLTRLSHAASIAESPLSDPVMPRDKENGDPVGARPASVPAQVPPATPAPAPPSVRKPRSRAGTLHPPATPFPQRTVPNTTDAPPTVIAPARMAPRPSIQYLPEFPHVLTPEYFEQHHQDLPFLPPPTDMPNENGVYPDYFRTGFDVIQPLGNGSFSEVFHVRRQSDGRHFALKRLKQPYKSDMDRRRRLEEVQVWYMVGRHTNCVALELAWEQHGRLYMLTELCLGGSLASYLQERAKEPLTESQAWDLLADIASGLAWLHGRNLAHLDLKPANILLTTASRGKVADFGLTCPADLLDTALYAAHAHPVTEFGDSQVFALTQSLGQSLDGGDSQQSVDWHTMANDWHLDDGGVEGDDSHMSEAAATPGPTTPEEPTPPVPPPLSANCSSSSMATIKAKPPQALGKFLSTNAVEDRDGDPLYAAPEVASGELSMASDVYALGLIALEMISNAQLPNGGESYDRLRRGDMAEFLPMIPDTTSPAMLSLIQACLLVDPHFRPTIDRILEAKEIKAALVRRAEVPEYEDVEGALAASSADDMSGVLEHRGTDTYSTPTSASAMAISSSATSTPGWGTPTRPATAAKVAFTPAPSKLSTITATPLRTRTSSHTSARAPAAPSFGFGDAQPPRRPAATPKPPPTATRRAIDLSEFTFEPQLMLSPRIAPAHDGAPRTASRASDGTGSGLDSDTDDSPLATRTITRRAPPAATAVAAVGTPTNESSLSSSAAPTPTPTAFSAHAINGPARTLAFPFGGTSGLTAAAVTAAVASVSAAPATPESPFPTPTSSARALAKSTSYTCLTAAAGAPIAPPRSLSKSASQPLFVSPFTTQSSPSNTTRHVVDPMSSPLPAGFGRDEDEDMDDEDALDVDSPSRMPISPPMGAFARPRGQPNFAAMRSAMGVGNGGFLSRPTSSMQSDVSMDEATPVLTRGRRVALSMDE
ncbi:hypothetical protein GGF31_003554 [Allomyces arbusculus]|nr:hypothetical protein GGF31_003554 [Allomyces arbusculus]